jgi:RNA polymerase sigma-70 factor (ECF subfamily)
MSDPEYALIKGIARGNQEAFERLVRRYQNPLCNFTYRYLGDRGVAEDITQEVFMQVYRTAPRFEPRGRVSSWMFAIARNLSLNEIKRRQRLDQNEMAMQAEHEYVDAFSSAAAEKHNLERDMMAALGELPENQRAALLLRVNEGLTYREISDALGMSVQSVESLIFRARQHLRTNLIGKQGE